MSRDKGPALQNIPIRTEEAKKIRDAFLTNGTTALLSADYSALELRILKHLKKD